MSNSSREGWLKGARGVNISDGGELARLMAQMVGDRAMVVPFVLQYQNQLAAIAREILAEQSRSQSGRQWDDVGVYDAEIMALVWDLALDLQARAGEWNPTDGSPWIWADLAVTGRQHKQLTRSA